jgi:hypothetical protein
MLKALKDLEDGRVVKAAIRKRLISGTRPALVAGKSAARGLPSKGSGKSSGLRAAIARTMRIQVRLGGDPTIRIVIGRSALGARGNLPRNMNKGAWRHPVFGHRRVQVIQTSRSAWFDSTMQQSRNAVATELNRVFSDLEGRLK